MVSGSIKTAIGLMSGTSRDGVDAALIESDGENKIMIGAALTLPYNQDMRRDIADLCNEEGYKLEKPRRALDQNLSLYHAKAVDSLIKKAGVSYRDVDVLGFHGQTLFHAPKEKITIQAGDPILLAEKTGIDVVFDFRKQDVVLGGEGAPLAPIFHKALFREQGKPLIIVNIGGIANLTLLGNQHFLAFDTGPGCGLIDDWMEAHGKGRVDYGGVCAKQGSIEQKRLDSYLEKFDFSATPRSFDRTDFTIDSFLDLSLEDGAAMASIFCAKAIMRAVACLPEKPLSCLICGGGRHNDFILQFLQQNLGIPVMPVEAKGYDGDMVEAQAFAYLAIRNLFSKPISFPETTGVKYPTKGGVLFSAQQAS